MSPAALGGAASALVSLALAAIAGGPYLSAERVNGWIVVFAAALLLTLVATPIIAERNLRKRRTSLGSGSDPHPKLGMGSDPEPKDERWEGAALAWGGVALAVLAVAVPVGLAESFSGGSLAGAAALVATIEAGLVVATLLVWLVSG